MLQTLDQEYYDKVMEFAKTRPPDVLEDLRDHLKYLDEYAEHGERGKTLCKLGRDYAPYSFSLLMLGRNEAGEYVKWWNGALIYYGAGDSGVGAPNFSVRLGSLKEGWTINT